MSVPPLPGEEPGVCPPGKQWQPCAHVPASCAELSAAPAAGGRCHPGCSCPPGALLLVRGDGEVGMGLVGTPPTPYPGATSYRMTSAWRRRNVPVPRTAHSTCPGTPCPGAARTGQCPFGGGVPAAAAPHKPSPSVPSSCIAGRVTNCSQVACGDGKTPASPCRVPRAWGGCGDSPNPALVALWGHVPAVP